MVWQRIAPVFDAARRYQDASFVYVVGEDQAGPVKIGTAKNPIDRIRTMQTGNSRRLRIEYVLVGDRSVERVLHELWEPWAIVAAVKEGKIGAAPGTEWFRAEVREQLFPILDSAVELQSGALEVGTTMDVMERLVRQAHIDHDFIAAGRDEVRLLARQGGYAIPRPSVL